MPNASNTQRVEEAIGGEDTTASRCIIAVQGPHARTRLAAVAPEAAAVPRFGVAPFVWEGVPCVAAGTGYTGEDGVECAVPADAADALWTALLATGIEPAGLGRTRHPPARGRPSPARSRARPGHHPAAGRARMGGRLGQGRPSGAGGPWPAERERGVARRLVGLTTDGPPAPAPGRRT